ncbi:MAG: hypothetical protein ABS939_06230 [Psychrobacillus sp.]
MLTIINSVQHLSRSESVLVSTKKKVAPNTGTFFENVCMQNSALHPGSESNTAIFKFSEDVY